jgi:hypothetical protein
LLLIVATLIERRDREGRHAMTGERRTVIAVAAIFAMLMALEVFAGAF